MWLVYYMLSFCIAFGAVDNSEEPVSYYYGLEESERGLPLCGERQACSVLQQRYWRRAALLRLCRCARRSRCPAAAARDQRTLYLNNRAHFKFCQPVDEWPYCSPNEEALVVKSSTPDVPMEPDRLETLHHGSIHMTPPQVLFKCRCNEPYLWEMNALINSTDVSYKCRPLPTCRSGEFCGNVNYELHSLYQACLCPRRQRCLHAGGLGYVNVTELLYRGKARQAFCKRFYDDESTYEDY